MALRDIIRGLTPGFLLQAYRQKKKNAVNRRLEAQHKQGDVFTCESLITDFKRAGINPGDTLLVHSSLSKIGYIEGGAATLVQALLATVGEKGNLLMPSSPNPSLQLDYIQKNKVFDVKNSPSRMGAVTEYFRKLPCVKRSLSPTEPVCAFGPDADYLTGGHLMEESPYTAKSPFYRVVEMQGKILYLGVTLINAGTSLHLLEDAIEDFPFPVYYSETFPVEVVDENGEKHRWNIKVHNPEMSQRRKCDDLIPLFEEAGCLSHCKIGKADALLLDARGMYDTMLRLYQERGVTMYTPGGRKI